MSPRVGVCEFCIWRTRLCTVFPTRRTRQPRQARGAELAAPYCPRSTARGLKLWQEILASLSRSGLGRGRTSRAGAIRALDQDPGMASAVLLETMARSLETWRDTSRRSSLNRQLNGCGHVEVKADGVLRVGRFRETAHAPTWSAGCCCIGQASPSAIPEAVKVYSAYLMEH